MNALPRRRDPASSAPVLAALVDSAPTAMVMVDGEGRIALVNAETERLFGHPREAILGEPVETLLPERLRERAREILGTLRERPQAQRIEAERRVHGLHRDGSEFPIEIGLRPLETDAGSFLLGTVVGDRAHRGGPADPARRVPTRSSSPGTAGRPSRARERRTSTWC